MTLEDELILDLSKGRNVNIERALLITSELDEESIKQYHEKLNLLERGFEEYQQNHKSIFFDITKPKVIARDIHNYLWENNKNRFFQEGNYLLSKVIDAQIEESSPVGNCVGLTSLYTMLCNRRGLDVAIMFMRKHIMPRVLFDDISIDVESQYRNGFGIKADKDAKQYSQLALVHSAFSGKFWDAVDNKDLIKQKKYSSAMMASLPEDYSSYAAKGLVYMEDQKYTEAIACFCKAIKLEPNEPSTYLVRGTCWIKKGDLKAASRDYDKAKEIAKK
ncbi:MAG: hypothetical protein WC852_04645 [Candidatus Nanoarchaeia archaeon]|jgi:tetratricopeptide (TPR) repeat protein